MRFDIQKEESENTKSHKRFSKRKWCMVVRCLYTVRIFLSLHITPGFLDIILFYETDSYLPMNVLSSNPVALIDSLH